MIRIWEAFYRDPAKPRDVLLGEVAAEGAFQARHKALTGDWLRGARAPALKLHRAVERVHVEPVEERGAGL